MDSWAQLGVAGVTLGILYVVVRSFIDTQKESQTNNRSLTEKFIQIVEKNLEIQSEATKATAKLTEVIYKVLNHDRLDRSKK